MNKLNNLLPIILFISILFSCGQAKTKKQAIDTTNGKTEKKYTKVISDSSNKLTNKIENLEVEYVVFGCACPNWIKTKDNINTDTSKKFNDLYFYIEPTKKSLDLPIFFDAFIQNLKIEGQFYEKEDYHQGTVEMEEPMPKAKVFRYTKLDIIDKPDFKTHIKLKP